MSSEDEYPDMTTKMAVNLSSKLLDYKQKLKLVVYGDNDVVSCKMWKSIFRDDLEMCYSTDFPLLPISSKPYEQYEEQLRKYLIECAPNIVYGLYNLAAPGHNPRIHLVLVNRQLKRSEFGRWAQTDEVRSYCRSSPRSRSKFNEVFNFWRARTGEGSGTECSLARNGAGLGEHSSPDGGENGGSVSSLACNGAGLGKHDSSPDRGENGVSVSLLACNGAGLGEHSSPDGGENGGSMSSLACNGAGLGEHSSPDGGENGGSVSSLACNGAGLGEHSSPDGGENGGFVSSLACNGAGLGEHSSPDGGENGGSVSSSIQNSPEGLFRNSTYRQADSAEFSGPGRIEECSKESSAGDRLSGGGSARLSSENDGAHQDPRFITIESLRGLVLPLIDIYLILSMPSEVSSATSSFSSTSSGESGRQFAHTPQRSASEPLPYEEIPTKWRIKSPRKSVETINLKIVRDG